MTIGRTAVAAALECGSVAWLSFEVFPSLPHLRILCGTTPIRYFMAHASPRLGNPCCSLHLQVGILELQYELGKVYLESVADNEFSFIGIL